MRDLVKVPRLVICELTLEDEVFDGLPWVTANVNTTLSPLFLAPKLITTIDSDHQHITHTHHRSLPKTIFAEADKWE